MKKDSRQIPGGTILKTAVTRNPAAVVAALRGVGVGKETAVYNES